MKNGPKEKKEQTLKSQNRKTLLAFELFFKLGLLSALIFFASGGLALTMKITGFSYLTLENVKRFALNPFTFIFLLLLIAVAVMGTLIDLGAVVYAQEETRLGQRADVPSMLRFAAKNALRAVKPGNLVLVPVVMALTPLLNLGLIVCILTTISIPEFITDAAAAYADWAWPVGMGLAAAYLAMTRWIYAFHCFTLENCSGLEALHRSAALGRKKRLPDFGALILNQAAFGACFFAALLALIAVAMGLSRLFSGIFVLRWVTSSVVWIALVLSILFAFAMSSAASFGRVSQMFYRRKLASGAGLPRLAAQAVRESPEKKKHMKMVYVSVAWIVAAACLCLAYLISTGSLNPPIEYIRATEVTAHRGASADYPENTMSAFRGAEELGADWIELDVQQTLDGEIVVMHDTNTRRTTGVSGKIWQMTYEEVAKLDAGSSFGKEFAGEPVPRLRDVLEFARETGIKLNIELKPTGHEESLEESVVDLIHEYEYEDSCVITSQVYRVLENVKAYDPEITTVYVARLAYGNINKLACADHFSVEATNATRRLVSRLHNEGRQIFAWTVNTRDSINKLIDRNVDNIITDNVPLALHCIYESRYSDLLSEFVKLLQ